MIFSGLLRSATRHRIMSLPVQAKSLRVTRRSARLLATAATATAHVDVAVVQEVVQTEVRPKRKRSARRTSSAVVNEGDEEDEAADAAVVSSDEDAAVVSPRKRKGRRAKTPQPVVYNIPDVEKKTTRFQGTALARMTAMHFTDVPVPRPAWLCTSSVHLSSGFC